VIATHAEERRTLGFLLVLSLAHGIVDLGAGALVALLPTLREHFSLSYTMVGTVMLFSNLTSSVTQPFFGIASDRAKQRWLLPLSLAFSGVGLAAIGWMPTYGMLLVSVVFAAQGVAAFHPEGAHAAHNLAAGRKARAMGIYSVGGNIGYALGTVYAAFLLSLSGGALQGMTWAFVIPLVLAAFIIQLLPAWQLTETATMSAERAVAKADLPATNWLGTWLVTLLAILRSIVQLGILTYLPFYWIDILKNPASTASYVQLTYLVAGVGGTLVGAPLADRFGTRKILAGAFAILLPLQFLLSHLSGAWLLVCLFAGGFVMVSTFTVTLVMTQDYMPRNLGLASGLNLGLAFGMGGVGARVLGMIADRWGVLVVLNTITAMVPVLLLLAVVLPPVQKAVRQA